MSDVSVPVLAGRLVRLEPLSPRHVADVARAAGEDRSSYGLTSVPDGVEGPGGAREYVRRMTSGGYVPFAQVRISDGRVVGATSFLTLRDRPDDGRLYAVEIGATWLAASAQGRGINREAKMLLLTHAFDVWGVGRVDLKTDARNDRSRRSIEGIGARFEGVLRNWQPSHALGEAGALRDTAMYSIVATEWPAVRADLQRSVGPAG